jgi:hypothetical protein
MRTHIVDEAEGWARIGHGSEATDHAIAIGLPGRVDTLY